MARCAGSSSWTARSARTAPGLPPSWTRPSGRRCGCRHSSCCTIPACRRAPRSTRGWSWSARWAKWLGLDETEKLAGANQQQAPAVGRVARRRATREEVQEALRKSGIESTPGRYSPDALVLAPGAPPALDIEGHDQGLFQAQDEAAQLVSLYTAPPPGANVLDACAAPGGKACHLAELGAGSVLAVDLHARKSRDVEEAARRLGLTKVRSLAADATLPLPGEGPFDLALVDAPCSGLGTLRRHPEVKLR